MFVRRQPNLWGIFAAGVEGIGESVGTAVIVRSARPKQGGGEGLAGCTPCAAAAEADAIQRAARRALPVRKRAGKW
jgi:hypothetical protein